jgi:hypothetical protein
MMSVIRSYYLYVSTSIVVIIFSLSSETQAIFQYNKNWHLKTIDFMKNANIDGTYCMRISISIRMHHCNPLN